MGKLHSARFMSQNSASLFLSRGSVGSSFHLFPLQLIRSLCFDSCVSDGAFSFLLNPQAHICLFPCCKRLWPSLAGQLHVLRVPNTWILAVGVNSELVRLCNS